MASEVAKSKDTATTQNSKMPMAPIVNRWSKVPTIAVHPMPASTETSATQMLAIPVKTLLMSQTYAPATAVKAASSAAIIIKSLRSVAIIASGRL